MKALFPALICILFIFSGCKKDATPGAEITAKNIVGKWTVSNIVFQIYKDGQIEREDPLEAYAYTFEFKNDGTVAYTEDNVTSSGEYTIKYDAAKGKYYIG